MRRVFLDVTGTLPTGAEAQQFLMSHNPDKRRELIDHLLARDEYADYLAMKWGDVLRIKAEFPINLWPNAAQAYHGWIREAIRTNEPCDQIGAGIADRQRQQFRECHRSISIARCKTAPRRASRSPWR